MAEDELIGQTLRGGEYLLKEVIARGGQATVYRAYARALETDVAVKVLHPEHAADLSLRERLHEEARRLAQLHHPNLLEVHWYGEEGELVYIVMRLVPGGTLLRRLQALGGSLGLTDAARHISQIAAALQEAHDHGILHLDVKPANVLLGQADWPLVADLGLTQAIAHQQTSSGEQRIAGTPAYMSPEQCRGDALDGRSDQYSLAVTAYELVVGQQPFHAETTEGLLEQQQHSPPPRPSSVNPGVPGPIEAVLLRGLAKDAQDRFPNVAAFGQALTDAVERTRGMSLEAKRAAAATAPNLLAVLGLVLAAPFLLAMLPVGSLFGRVPLAWPFQGLLAVAMAALLLGMRWQLIGLVSRGVGAALGDVAWRRAAQASAQGVVNLLYLLATYRLVGGPLLAILQLLVPTEAFGWLETGLAVVVGVCALGIVYSIFRSAGAMAAAVILSLGWALAISLPTARFELGDGQAVAATAQLVVAGGVLLLLLSQRSSAASWVARLASAGVGRLLVESRPGMGAEEAHASREQIGRLAASLLDFGYLLLGYTLLRGPLLGVIAPRSSGLAAAIVASTLAIAVWLWLTARLHWIGGLVGVALGLVLGAPILLTLPLLDASLLQTSWPATLASWLAGATILLLLAVLRGPSEALARTGLGKRLDRGLLGASPAGSEAQAAERVGALGGVVGALLDVGFLLVVYWTIGVPLTDALVRATGQPVLSSIVLGAVVVLAMATVLVAARRAASRVAETTGANWGGRSRALVGLAGASAALLLALGAAAPAAVAGPTPISTAGMEPALSRQFDQVIVDWDFWVPWSPRADQATYNLALSCSNGQPIGEFREAYTPPSAIPMPAGSVGGLGPTGVPCSDWQQVYTDHRHAAGLADANSYSWEWLDVQSTVNADQSMDVTETHRVFFSAGHQSSLTWSLGPSANTSLDNLQVLEGDTPYPVISSGDAAPPSGPYAELLDSGGQRTVEWFFADTSAPAERTFILRYHLRTSAGTDPQTLFQQVVAAAAHTQPVWNTTIEVHLAPDADTRGVQLSSTGVDTRNGLLNSQTAVFAAQDIAGGDGVSVMIDRTGTGPNPIAPTALPAPTDTPTPVPTDTAPPTVAPIPTETPTPEPTQTQTPTPAAVAQTINTPAPAPTRTPAARASRAPTVTPTPPLSAPSPTPDLATSDTPTPAPTDTAAPTAAPDTPTPALPTSTPSPTPALAPTDTPTPALPTSTPSPTAALAPTDTPTPALPTSTATPPPPTETPTPAPPTSTPTPPLPTSTATPPPPTDTPTPPPPTSTPTPPPPTSTPTPPPPTSTPTPPPPTRTPTPPPAPPKVTPTPPPITILRPPPIVCEICKLLPTATPQPPIIN